MEEEGEKGSSQNIDGDLWTREGKKENRVRETKKVDKEPGKKAKNRANTDIT